jgi:ABC-type sugar transport system, permease component
LIKKKSFLETLFDSSNIVFMFILSVLFIYPLYYCLISSISDPSLLEVTPGLLILPLGFSLDAYKDVLSNNQMLRGLFNTVFYVIFGTMLNLLMTAFAAYVLSRKGFYWKKFLFVFILITMYFSGGLIPFYLLVKNLKLTETPWAILLPAAINTFYLIIMRTYFLSIPSSMEESAVIDGANDFQILFRVILPLAMPVVAVMIIYYGVGHWNDWFYSMIFLLKHKEWQPLQLILRDILMMNNAQTTGNLNNSVDAQRLARLIKYALIVITVLPIILIYPFMQKHFVKGVMIGSIKE